MCGLARHKALRDLCSPNINEYVEGRLSSRSHRGRRSLAEKRLRRSDVGAPRVVRNLMLDLSDEGLPLEVKAALAREYGLRLEGCRPVDLDDLVPACEDGEIQLARALEVEHVDGRLLDGPAERDESVVLQNAD